MGDKITKTKNILRGLGYITKETGKDVGKRVGTYMQEGITGKAAKSTVAKAMEAAKAGQTGKAFKDAVTVGTKQKAIARGTAGVAGVGLTAAGAAALGGKKKKKED